MNNFLQCNEKHRETAENHVPRGLLTSEPIEFNRSAEGFPHIGDDDGNEDFRGKADW